MFEDNLPDSAPTLTYIRIDCYQVGACDQGKCEEVRPDKMFDWDINPPDPVPTLTYVVAGIEVRLGNGL